MGFTLKAEFMRAQPFVIDRFVDYYAGLDRQTVMALAGLYDVHAVHG